MILVEWQIIFYTIRVISFGKWDLRHIHKLLFPYLLYKSKNKNSNQKNNKKNKKSNNNKKNLPKSNKSKSKHQKQNKKRNK
jgi:hypothetical protein